MPQTRQAPADLPFRARKILYAVVTEYVSTGEPVGSRRLAKRYGINLSPATIRNVLADLTDFGYLSQPHTSAGRVPTERGFRLFVDALIQMREVTNEDREAVMERIQGLRPGVDDLVEEAGRLLATMAGAAAVFTRPRADTEALTQIRFMPLRPGEVLALVITKTGAIQNRVVPSPDLEPAALERLNNYLSEKASGKTLAELRRTLADEMDDERGQVREVREQAQDLVSRATEGSDAPGEVVIEGRDVLFDRPEFADAEKIRTYLRTFDEKERLLDLLDQTIAAGGVQVLIGSETELEGVPDISLITASYRRGGLNAGTVGVIGPTRMDYGKLVPLVGFTAQVMSDVLDGVAPSDEEE
ncbi:MAG TPA: heat-inducible transcriptional repressor HrcA [Sandaracinaceae bacterium LLY-WYZ-13_1]|nr:heat-inducible transcriptional repressor HrcA [Sandaracinaceae bacterium LLY-WYZ-13_1]